NEPRPFSLPRSFQVGNAATTGGFRISLLLCWVWVNIGKTTQSARPPREPTMKNAALNRPRRQADDSLRINRCEQILDAAVKLFAKHGYSDADTQLLANELGVGKGTLYRYFPSKRELFLAAADRGMQRVRDRIDGCIQGIVDPLERIATALRTYLAFFGEHPDYVELLMQERAQFKDRNEPTYFQHRKVQRERWRSVYGDLIAQGRI